MTPAEFKLIRVRKGYSIKELAEFLEISVRMIQYYEVGFKTSKRHTSEIKIPKVLAIAMKALIPKPGSAAATPTTIRRMKIPDCKPKIWGNQK